MYKATTLLFLFFLCQQMRSQEYTDSTYNSEQKIRFTTYTKYNRKEGVCDFYFNDTLRLKLKGLPSDFYYWSVETVDSSTYYLNGKTKTTGQYLVIKTTNYYWSTPILRHFSYRRNGKFKRISQFSDYGIPIRDFYYKRNGKLTKTIVHKI
jgi:hypothetical protein